MLPFELHEQLSHNRLALLLGAELPAALTGMPSRTELAVGLAQRAGLPTDLGLAATTQRAMQAGNRFSFTDYVGRMLDVHGKMPQRLHHLITRLPLDTIITTAYDGLLEQAFVQAGRPLNRIIRDNDLAFTEPQRLTLIKLYGDLQQRDTLIITEDDHYSLLHNQEKAGLLDEVRRVLRTRAVLIIGHNLADPDFMLLWRETLDRAGRFALGAYAVHPSMPHDQRQVWEDRHIRILDIEALAVLEELAGMVPNEGTNVGSESAESKRGIAESSSQPQAQTVVTRPDSAEIERQLDLLEAHRRTLGVLLKQLATFTSVHAPPHIITSIHESRSNIAQIKVALRIWGVAIADIPGE